MAYSERIKNFELVRDYMRQFYVYGFKTRDEYDKKSTRSYDNERRRIESWLGDYISFRQDVGGKNVFLSVDSRRVPHNPFHRAFKAKTFTDRDVTLHFYLLDLLADGSRLTARSIVERIFSDYLPHFARPLQPDESTVRKKLKEYESIGLLRSEKVGREVFYRRADDGEFHPERWLDALAFYTEVDPLGVIGSFLLDKWEPAEEIFRFKHHYLLHALDSDVLCHLLPAIREGRKATLTVKGLHSDLVHTHLVCPLKIYCSTRGGRQYLLSRQWVSGRFVFHRLDAILSVEVGDPDPEHEAALGQLPAFQSKLWGVSAKSGTSESSLHHIEMTVRIRPGEEFVFGRLEREKRGGRVEQLDPLTCRFSADVFDPFEMLPWLRTFIGRIAALECSDPRVTARFRADLERMQNLYGGDEHALP